MISYCPRMAGLQELTHSVSWRSIETFHHDSWQVRSCVTGTYNINQISLMGFSTKHMDLPRKRARLSRRRKDRSVSSVSYRSSYDIPGIDHVVHKSANLRLSITLAGDRLVNSLIRKEEHLQTDLDRNQGEENLEPSHKL